MSAEEIRQTLGMTDAVAAFEVSIDIAAVVMDVAEWLRCGVTIQEEAVVESVESTRSFCITGATTKPRDWYIDRIGKSGYTYKSGVSKNLDFLVTNFPDHSTGKMKKAQKLGIKVISEKELVRMLGLNEEAADKTKEAVDTPEL